MSHFRIFRNRRAAIWLMLIFIVITVAFVYAVSINDPDRRRADFNASDMEATQTIDALLATVDKDKLGDEVIAEAQRNGEIWVSVKLTDPKDVSFSTETLDEWARSISTIQAQMLQDIEGHDFRDVELLSHVSGMSLKCDLETLIVLQSNPLVQKIQIAGEGTTQGLTGPA